MPTAETVFQFNSLVLKNVACMPLFSEQWSETNDLIDTKENVTLQRA